MSADPSWAIAAGIALLLLALCLFDARLLNDGDTYWHVAAGNWMLSHVQVPHVDTFSFSRSGARWQAHEWLAEVAMAAAFAVEQLERRRDALRRSARGNRSYSSFGASPFPSACESRGHAGAGLLLHHAEPPGSASYSSFADSSRVGRSLAPRAGRKTHTVLVGIRPDARLGQSARQFRIRLSAARLLRLRGILRSFTRRALGDAPGMVTVFRPQLAMATATPEGPAGLSFRSR